MFAAIMNWMRWHSISYKNDITKTIIEKNTTYRYRAQFYSDSMFK